MKKFLLLLVSLVLLTGCQDFMVDAPKVHNGLVDRLDSLLLDEQHFYDASLDLTEGQDNKAFSDAYEAFTNSALDLDDYYKDTTFHSTQQIFVESYHQYYKPFIDKYLAAAKNVKERIEKEGYNYENMKDVIGELDTDSEEFVKMHNKLIDTINLQADKL